MIVALRQEGSEMANDGIVYLDHNATTPLSPRALAAMMPFLSGGFANPSSPSPEGEDSRRAVSESREKMAAFLGCRPPEIVFTGGGTEGNVTAILSALALSGDRREILSTPVEHPSVMQLLDRLGRQGYRVRFFPVDGDGCVDSRDLARMAGSDTALIVMMWANNETGVLFPVEEAAAVGRSVGARVHSDAVAAAGKVPIDLATVGVDTLSLSGHKIYGPKGTGALFVRKGTPFEPLFPGSQERKRRSGTENVPGIAGMGEAAEESRSFLSSGSVRETGTLRDRLERSVLELFPGAFLNGRDSIGSRVPHVTNLGFSGVSGEKLLHRLVSEGIRASTGSACSTGSMEPSHVLLSMGLSREEALSSLRFSLGRQTTPGQIARTIDALVRAGRDLGLVAEGAAPGRGGAR